MNKLKKLKELEKINNWIYKQFKEITERYENDMLELSECVETIGGLLFGVEEEIKKGEKNGKF